MNEGHDDPPKLPTRERSSRPGTGRHRRPLPAELPHDAPALVLAVPGRPTDAAEASEDVAAEVATIVRLDNPQIDLRIVSLGDGGADLTKEFSTIAAERSADGYAAVVVPLVTGPHPRVLRAVRDAVTQSETAVKITEPLGPHPLLAEALHVRLAEAGLARADRMRLFNVSSPVDGIIVATAGGDEAARGADATSVLLAARLTLPVVPAALDGVPTIRDAAERLHKIGANRLAVVPYVIGPEADLDRVMASAEAIGAGCAAPLGAHEAVARMVCVRYGAAFGGFDGFDDLSE
ncbi:sirohydrochlorin chelatase [Microbispora sp. NPDC049125]|uniref:sirohydrochlorin chelatase n=1 Tax=Microbispora sp. NPDC049125 TaxID=3154929 RepID=UPI0034672A1C